MVFEASVLGFRISAAIIPIPKAGLAADAVRATATDEPPK
jgi:hypothetical protein